METTSTAPNGATLDIRVRKAKRVIREATAAALKFAHIQETDLSNVYQSDEDAAMQHQDAFDPAASPDPEGNVNNTNGMNEAEEFDLAMTLFGDDIRGIEEDLNDKLILIENDIYNYFAHKEQQQQQQQHEFSNDGIADFKISEINNESFGIDPKKDLDPNSKQQLLEQEAKQLHAKIAFLQKCSRARVALDEADQYSLQASTGSRKSVMMSSANQLDEAIRAVKLARQDFQSSENTRSSHSDGDCNSDGDMSASDQKVARAILYSIEDQIRRKVSDLSSKAMSIIDSCIVITSNSISICEGPVNAGGVTFSADGSGNALHDSTNVESSSEHAYEGLKVALEVLKILSRKDENQGRDRLGHAVGIIANQVLTIILRPVIDSVYTAFENGSGVITRYTFEESTAKSTMGPASSKLAGFGPGKKIKGVITTLEWNSNASTESTGMDDKTSSSLEWWTALLGFIQRITEFMRDKVLTQGPSDSIYPMFGSAVFGTPAPTKNTYSLPFDSDIVEHGRKCPILKLLGRLLWEHCIPQECNQEVLQGLGGIGGTVKESIAAFDSFLMNSRLIDTHTALSEYGTEFNMKYTEKVRTSILGRGRKILLDGDYHNSVQVGINVHEQKKGDRPAYMDILSIEEKDMSMFLLEACGISQVASDLMELCRQTMELSVDKFTSSQPLIPPTLFRSSRELLDLYRATIPTVHGSEIASIPRTAAIFHNDCVFFAHNLLTFGLEYRDRFLPDSKGNESPMKRMCTFLDLVPMFRELAERTINDMIWLQKRQLCEIVNPRLEYLRDALGSNEGVVEWTDAETAVTAGLYHLRHLSQAWKSMLPHQVYCITMGSIVDSLLKIFLDKVLGTKDISAPACHFVSALFRNAISGIAEVFGSPFNPTGGSKDAENFCALQPKFAAVGNFMDMGLADINMALSEGVFRSLTGAELSRLVKAVFQDSEGRMKLLRLLESN